MLFEDGGPIRISGLPGFDVSCWRAHTEVLIVVVVGWTIIHGLIGRQDAQKSSAFFTTSKPRLALGRPSTQQTQSTLGYGDFYSNVMTPVDQGLSGQS